MAGLYRLSFVCVSIHNSWLHSQSQVYWFAVNRLAAYGVVGSSCRHPKLHLFSLR